MRRALRIVAVVLVIGAVITALIASASALIVDLAASGTTPAPATSIDGDVRWNVVIRHTATGWQIDSSRIRGGAWTATQATGKPDTPTQGDVITAWASATPDGQAEWLELFYDPPVASVAAVSLYESYNPGAVTRVTLFPTDQGDDRDAVVAWEGQAKIEVRSLRSVTVPTTQRVLTITSDAASSLQHKSIRRVKLDIDSPAVPGWNEIDAVGLQDRAGTMHWARRALASSSYGNDQLGQPTSPAADALVPWWADVRRPERPFAVGEVNTEHRLVEYRGWPLPALRADVLGQPAPVLPIRPVPFGFAVDTLIFAVVAALAGVLLRWPARFVTESNRLRRGCCLRCGYDLQYNLTAGCPECGWRRGTS